jgi:hypothetical protein
MGRASAQTQADGFTAVFGTRRGYGIFTVEGRSPTLALPFA